MPQAPPKHGRHCWVAGWGHMTEGFNVASVLQVISAPFSDLQQLFIGSGSQFIFLGILY